MFFVYQKLQHSDDDAQLLYNLKKKKTLENVKFSSTKNEKILSVGKQCSCRIISVDFQGLF